MNNNFYTFVLKYASRSLLRHKRRSIITILTVSLCLSISIVASRYAVSVMNLWKAGAADTGTAHFQYHIKDYDKRSEGMAYQYTLAENNDFEKRLRSDPDVEAISKRLKFEGLIKTADSSYYFIATAINPAEEEAVSTRLFWTGQQVEADHKESGVIANGLATLLKLKIGDEATLVSQTVHGSANAVDIVVNGFVNIPLPGFSHRVLYLNLNHAQTLLRMPDRYNELAIRLKPEVNQYRWFEKNKDLALKYGGELSGWWSVDPLIGKAEKIWNRISSILCLLLFMSAALTVLNVIFMIVNERVVEIGTLKAIGAHDKDVKLLISFEAAMIGIIGGIIGIAVGNIVVFTMGVTGVPFQSPFGGGQEIAYPSVDYIWSIIFFLCAIAGCAACAILPSKKATALQPVDAFRKAS